MSLPTTSDVHVDSALTSISVAYLQRQDQFAARTVFPVVPVAKQSDVYYKYNRGDQNRDQAAKRAPGAESSGGGYRLTTEPYSCDVWAIHSDVTDPMLANADAALNPEDDAAEFVMHQLLIRQEAEFASSFMAGGIWANDFDGVASSPSAGETIQWSDMTSGDPIGDMRTAKYSILENTGQMPNVLVIGARVLEALVDHPDIVDRVKYGAQTTGSPAQVNEQTLAALFGLDRIVVSTAVQNTAAEGLAESSSFIVGKHALLTHSAPNPGLMVPSAGYTFSWNAYLGQSNGLGIATQRLDLRPVDRKVTRIVGEIAMDMKVVSSDLGFFWEGIVA